MTIKTEIFDRYNIFWELDAADDLFVNFKIYDMIDEEIIADGSVKWDGCSNWDLCDYGMTHFCGPDHIDKFAGVLKRCQLIAKENIIGWDGE